MENSIADITEQVEGDDVPLCPLCHHPILMGELVKIGHHSVGVLCLVHYQCVDHFELPEVV